MFGAGVHGAGAVSAMRAGLRVGDWRPSVVSNADYYDDFYAFGSITLQSRAPLIRPRSSTAAWNIINASGNAALQSGHLELGFPSVNQSIPVLDFLTDNAEIRMEFEFPASGGTSRAACVALRVLDSNNYWIAQAQLDGGTVRIIQNAAGFTNRATGTYTWLADTRYAIRFKVASFLFTATYYTVFGGVDTLITPLTGTNPQVYDATALGAAAGTGRTLHGLRAGNTVGGSAVRIYKFEGYPTPLPVDATVTVAGSSTVTSRMIPAVSFVESPPLHNATGWANAKTSLASAVGAIKTHIFPFGNGDPWLSDNSGPTEVNPSQWGVGNRLTLMLSKIRELDASIPIILTLYGGTWWMKEDLDSTSTVRQMNSTETFSSSGRVKSSQLANWLIMVDEAVALAAAQGCRDFEIWNEWKGFNEVYPHVGQTWDSTMNPGNTGPNPVMGYSYFWQQTHNQIQTTMTGLGITVGNYRITGPYPVLATKGASSSDAVASNHPLYPYNTTWGYANKNAINATIAFLGFAQANSFKLDALSLDASTFVSDGVYPSANPFDYSAKFDHLTAYWRTVLPTYGFSADLPIDYGEIYSFPTPALQTDGQEALRCALWADCLRGCLVNRVRYPIAWSAIGLSQGATNPDESGIITTPVSNINGGQLTLVGNLFAFVKAHFGPGVALLAVTSDNGQLSGFASVTHMVVFNKTASDLTVNVDSTVMSFTHYETKLITR